VAYLSFSVKIVTGEELNEILTEFVARILSSKNMLSPTADEIQWFKDTRIYADLDGINQLMTVYCAINNQVDKITYIGSLIKSLQFANLKQLRDEIAKYDTTTTPGDILNGTVAPGHASDSSDLNLLDLLRDALYKML
jgi:hypothetical protein